MNVLDRLETTLRVNGGQQLSGSVETHGSKNAALPIMAAALLAKTPVTLRRVPHITDVSVMWQLLESLGAGLRSDGPGIVTIDASNIAKHKAPYTLVRKLAASFDLVGPCSGASAGPRFRCPAAACSARARRTCTSRPFARSAPRSRTRTAI
jgi:UDP-N-acetylglucosamine 1-carboxyvinyltransferase